MGYGELIKKKSQQYDSELIEQYINTAMTSTLQDEFYSKKNEQTEKVLKVHNKMMSKHRDFYGISLLLNINDIQKTVAILNLIKNKSMVKAMEEWENNLILDTLKKMPVHRAYKTLYVLAKNKVNNARAKWLARQFIRERGNRIIFESVKYKRLLKALAVHYKIHFEKICSEVDKCKDINRFLFEKEIDKITTKLYNSYFKARKDKKYIKELPYSVAEGFKQLHKVDDKEFMELTKDNLTQHERKRVQHRAKEAGVEVKIDLSKYSPSDILKFLHSKLTTYNKDKGFEKFMIACMKETNKLKEYFEFDEVRVLLDTSASMYGSAEKPNHPISVAEAIGMVLANLGKKGIMTAAPNKHKFLNIPKDETNLSDELMELIKDIDFDKDTLLVIISDGYENSVEGMVDQIIKVLKKFDKKEKVTLLHLNPVFAPEAEDIKKLSELMDTYGIRSEKQLFTILLLSVIKNKQDKKIREIIEKEKKKVKVRVRKTKKKKSKEAEK